MRQPPPDAAPHAGSTHPVANDVPWWIEQPTRTTLLLLLRPVPEAGQYDSHPSEL